MPKNRTLLWDAGLRRPAIVPLTREDAIRSSRSLAPIPNDARIEVKRSTVAELRRELGAQNFLPPADPARSVWVIAATGEIGRGGSKVWPWAVVVLDVDEHIVLGVQLGDPNTRPTYFDRLAGG